MPTESELEAKLKSTILPDLEKGRPNWDAPHTELVAAKLKEILENTPDLQVDRVVLLIVAYCHDWGYVDLFHGRPGYSLQEVTDKKAMHMELGAEKTRHLLQEPFFDFLTAEQKDKAIHLVAIHDKLAELHTPEELLFMEADTLGALAMHPEKSNFSAKDELEYTQLVENLRLPKFVTRYGKEQAAQLIQETYRRLTA